MAEDKRIDGLKDGLRRVLPLIRGAAGGLVLATACAGLSAQSAYPPEALANATSTTAAANALGAVKPEQSGYLLIDAPDIALPGKLRISVESRLPGTSQLVLLRTSRRPVGAAQTAPEKVLVAATQFAPGEKPQLKAEIDATNTLNLVLMAQFRGQWFYATRQVKIGSAPD